MTENVLSPSSHPPRMALLRLQLKPELPAAARVDGAWWPWSSGLAKELSALLPTLSDRLGEIAIVVFNPQDWDQDLPSSLGIDGDVVRLEGLASHDAGTLAVVGADGQRLTLIVVPPDAAGPAAARSLTAASQADPLDVEADAEARALDEVVGLLARQEATGDSARSEQIRRWVNETADRFENAPVKNYVPILVEHIVRDLMYHSSTAPSAETRERPLSSVARFDIGATVTCSDSSHAGGVKRVVADPLQGRLTHLVVGKGLGDGEDRLVPIDMARPTSSTVVLTCDAAQFRQLRPAVETEFIASSLDQSGYGPEETFLWPHFGLSAGGMGTAGFRVSAQGFNGTVGHDARSHQVPAGEVELRRGSVVSATDGPTGRLHGLIIDQATSRITHLLLQHGHLWGHREVAIPLTCVATMPGDISLNISKDDVEKLPHVPHDALGAR